MAFAKNLAQLTEKKDDILSLALSLIFIILSVIHVALILMGQHIEQMCMVFGTIAILLLLLNMNTNLLTVLAVMIMGTFVADEEFLLEVAAISKGEQLATVRNSRNFEVLTVTPEAEVETALTKKLTSLLQQEQDPEKIIYELERFRYQLEIEEDLPGFEAQDKDAIELFARYGSIDEQKFYNLMQNKGYSDEIITRVFEKLGAAEYVYNNSEDIDQAQLTEKGVALAKSLGLAPANDRDKQAAVL